MMRLIRLLIAAVAAVYLIVFAVQNRDVVDVVVWPHTSFAPLSLPVWGVLLSGIVIGIVLAAIAVWLGGWRWRSRAAAAHRTLRSQERRQEAAERREEYAAAQRAAERRKAAELEKKRTPALAAPSAQAPATGSLVLPSQNQA